MDTELAVESTNLSIIVTTTNQSNYLIIKSASFKNEYQKKTSLCSSIDNRESFLFMFCFLYMFCFNQL